MFKKNFMMMIFISFTCSHFYAGDFFSKWEEYNCSNRQQLYGAVRYMLHKISPTRFDAPLIQSEPETSNSVPFIIPSLQELVQDDSPIHEYVRYIKKLEEIESYHVKMTRALLLYGPPGTGKTTIAKAIAKESEFEFIEILGSEFASKYMSEEAQSIRDFFAELRKNNRKTILLVDEIDTLGSAGNTEERNVEYQRSLTRFWKELEDQKNSAICVIATTNRYKNLNPALIRSGRFYEHIEIGLPDESSRRKILSFYLAQVHIALPEELITKIARETEGFSGADLESFVNKIEAKTLLNKEQSEDVIKLWVESELTTKKAQVKQAKDTNISPLDRALKALESHSSADETKPVFNHEKDIKDLFSTHLIGDRPEVIEDILFYFKDTEAFERANVEIPRGLLLYGPPGTGKTTIARVLAGESGLDLISLSGSDFAQKYYGEGAKFVHALFDYARDLQRMVILFIDEIDSVGLKRSDDGNAEDRKILNALLAELTDERNDNIFVIGATNHLEALDKAFLRRLNNQVEIKLPDQNQRQAIFEFYLNKHKHALLEKSTTLSPMLSTGGRPTVFSTIMQKMENNGCSGPNKAFSGSDIKTLVNKAATKALIRGSNILREEDFNKAYEEIQKKNAITASVGEIISRGFWRSPFGGIATTLSDLRKDDERLDAERKGRR